MTETIVTIIACSILVLILAVYIQRWMIHRGSLRNCPHCQSVIPGAAKVCKECHRDL